MYSWAKRLNDMLALRGWTQAELARRAGVSKENVKKYCQGAVGQPRGETIPRLAEALDIHFVWLRDGVGPQWRRIPVVGYVGAGEQFHAIDDLSQLPEDRYAIVEYTELVADPRATVEKVYRRLNLSVSPDFAQRLSAERSRQQRYHSSNVYSLQEFGLSEAELSEKLSGIIERFGFRPEDVPDRETRELL